MHDVRLEELGWVLGYVASEVHELLVQNQVVHVVLQVEVAGSQRHDKVPQSHQGRVAIAKHADHHMTTEVGLLGLFTRLDNTTQQNENMVVLHKSIATYWH